jgi:hypothetical protein
MIAATSVSVDDEIRAGQVERSIVQKDNTVEV